LIGSFVARYCATADLISGGINAGFCNRCVSPDNYDSGAKAILIFMEATSKVKEPPATGQRLAYSVQEAADLLGVNYFSIYRLIKRGNLKVCRALRGKLLVPRTELLKLLKT